MRRALLLLGLLAILGYQVSSRRHSVMPSAAALGSTVTTAAGSPSAVITRTLADGSLEATGPGLMTSFIVTRVADGTLQYDEVPAGLEGQTPAAPAASREAIR